MYKYILIILLMSYHNYYKQIAVSSVAVNGLFAMFYTRRNPPGSASLTKKYNLTKRDYMLLTNMFL